MKADHYPGNIYIITAPSGAGKSTLIARLMADDPRVVYSISHTTRAPREGEKHGCHYFFVARQEFEELVASDHFLEWARVHDHFYGTSKGHLVELLSEGKDVILDIDVDGAAQVKQKLPSAVSIFVLPPGYSELRNRLEKRGKDASSVVERRLRNATFEVSRVWEFDFTIINDDLENCYGQLRTLIAADRLRTFRRRKVVRKVIETFSNNK